MTVLTIMPGMLAKWLHQNKAEYTGDYVEGVLLDNCMVDCKGGYAAIYEEPRNELSSIYRIEFERGSASTVWERWNKFEEVRNA